MKKRVCIEEKRENIKRGTKRKKRGIQGEAWSACKVLLETEDLRGLYVKNCRGFDFTSLSCVIKEGMYKRERGREEESEK